VGVPKREQYEPKTTGQGMKAANKAEGIAK
jgi:hypothetical protein